MEEVLASQNLVRDLRDCALLGDLNILLSRVRQLSYDEVSALEYYTDTYIDDDSAVREYLTTLFNISLVSEDDSRWTEIQSRLDPFNAWDPETGSYLDDSSDEEPATKLSVTS